MLDASLSNVQFQKSYIGHLFASFSISFLHPINCILDTLPSIFVYYTLLVTLCVYIPLQR